jgi:hypothetical protein
VGFVEHALRGQPYDAVTAQPRKPLAIVEEVTSLGIVDKIRSLGTAG